MVTFISQESRIDVRFSPLVTCDMFSETHTHTHIHNMMLRESKTGKELSKRKPDRVKHLCVWKRWLWPDFDRATVLTLDDDSEVSVIPSHASGVISSINPNDFYCVTPIWSGLDSLLFLLSDDEITELFFAPGCIINMTCGTCGIICFCNDCKDHLASVWSKGIIDSPPLKFTGLIQFCGTPREWLTLPLDWFVNWVSVLGVSRTNLNCTINLLVLVKCVGACSSAFTFVFLFSWQKRPLAQVKALHQNE